MSSTDPSRCISLKNIESFFHISDVLKSPIPNYTYTSTETPLYLRIIAETSNALWRGRATIGLISVPPHRHFLPVACANNALFPWNVGIVSSKQNFRTSCIQRCNLLLLHRPHNKGHTEVLRKAPRVIINTYGRHTENSSLFVCCSLRLAVAATSPTSMHVVLYNLLC